MRLHTRHLKPVSEAALVLDSLVDFIGLELVDRSRVNTEDPMASIFHHASIGYQGAARELAEFVQKSYDIPLSDLLSQQSAFPRMSLKEVAQHISTYHGRTSHNG